MCPASPQHGPPGPTKPFLLLLAVVAGLGVLWFQERGRHKATPPSQQGLQVSTAAERDNAQTARATRPEGTASPVVPLPAELQGRITTLAASLRGAEPPGTLRYWTILFALGPRSPQPVLDWALKLLGKAPGGVVTSPSWAGPEPVVALRALLLAAGKATAEAEAVEPSMAGDPLTVAWQLEVAALRQLRQGPAAKLSPALPVLFESALRELQRPQAASPGTLHRLAQSVFRSSVLMQSQRHQRAVKVAFGRLRQHQAHVKTPLSQLEWLETLASYIESRRTERLPKLRQQLRRQATLIVDSTKAWETPDSTDELYQRAIALRGLRLAKANW